MEGGCLKIEGYRCERLKMVSVRGGEIFFRICSVCSGCHVHIILGDEEEVINISLTEVVEVHLDEGVGCQQET